LMIDDYLVFLHLIKKIIKKEGCHNFSFCYIIGQRYIMVE